MCGRLKILLVSFALAILAGACSQTPQGGSAVEETTETAVSEYPVIIKDSLGRTVKIREEPEKIASMTPSVTETIYLVGAGEKVVGVTTADDHPKRVKKVEKIGDFTGVNAEKVASLDTDLLFLSYDSTTKEQAGDLENKTGAKTIVINPTTVEEAIASVGTVGKVVGEKHRARTIQKRLEGQLEDVQSAVEGEPEPTVFYELGYDPLYTVGPGSFVNDAIETAGGNNVAADSGQAYPQYPVEKLLQKDPKYYLVGSSTGETERAVKGRNEYSSLSAVEQDRVYVLDDNLISRPGPRIVKGVRAIAETIHPDAL